MMGARRTAAPRWPLVYVCKWCGAEVARFPNVASHEPSTLSVCDRPDCVAAAAADYRRTR